MRKKRLFPAWLGRIWVIVGLSLFWLAACQPGAAGVKTAPTLIPSPLPASPFASPVVTASPTWLPTATALLPQPTPSPTVTALPWGTIRGSVWEDRCAPGGAPFPCQTTGEGQQVGDGQRQPGEPALAGVVVYLAQGPCPGTLLSKTATDAQGKYTFPQLAPGTYCVLVDEQDPAHVSLLTPGVWTRPEVGQGQQSVELPPGGEAEVNFARTLQRAEQVQVVSPTLSPTLPPSATPTSTMTPIPAPTLTDAQKPYALGEPQMHDPMNTPGAHWLIFNTFPWAHVEPGNGKLLVTILKPDPTHTLWIRSTYPPLKDAYLEAVFQTGKECRRKDRYGLVVRSPSKYEGIVFVISCDAMYKIYRWNGGFTLYRNWTHAPMVHPGGGQTNRIGVWMEGNTLKLYINRTYVDEIREDLFTEGAFAIMVSAERTPNFQVAVDEVNYWTELP